VSVFELAKVILCTIIRKMNVVRVMDDVREATWYIYSLNFYSANQVEVLPTTIVVNTGKIGFLSDPRSVNIFQGTQKLD